MARRAELAVLPGSRDLAEHIFINVALGVAVVHLHRIELVDDLGEQRCRRDGVARLLHVPADVAAARDLLAQEWEDVLVDDLEHLLRLEGLEARPAQIFVGAPARVLALWKNAPLQRLLQHRRLALLDRLQLVEPLDEKQIGDLLHDAERI